MCFVTKLCTVKPSAPLAYPIMLDAGDFILFPNSKQHAFQFPFRPEEDYSK